MPAYGDVGDFIFDDMRHVIVDNVNPDQMIDKLDDIQKEKVIRLNNKREYI